MQIPITTCIVENYSKLFSHSLFLFKRASSQETAGYNWNNQYHISSRYASSEEHAVHQKSNSTVQMNSSHGYSPRLVTPVLVVLKLLWEVPQINLIFLN